MDRGSQGSEEAPWAQGQSRVPAEQTDGAAQPKDGSEVGAPAPLDPKIQVRCGERGWGGRGREQPEQKPGGWTSGGLRGSPGGWLGAGQGGPEGRLEEVRSWMVGFECQVVGLAFASGLWGATGGLKQGSDLADLCFGKIKNSLGSCRSRVPAGAEETSWGP